MAYAAWFDTDENRALLAICTRKLIGNIGVAGIIWGLLNFIAGLLAMQVTLLNGGLVILGLLMLGTGLQAFFRPSLGVLLSETIVSVLLFLWNLGISILNANAGGAADARGLVLPLVAAGVMANYYHKLGHLRQLIAGVAPEKIKATKLLCKALGKRKLKDEPRLVETSNRRCRVQLLDGRAFVMQRDLLRAFVVLKADLRQAVAKADARSLKLQFNHPVGKLTYQFDRKNSDKLKSWLAPAGPPPLAAAPAAAPAAGWERVPA